MIDNHRKFYAAIVGVGLLGTVAGYGVFRLSHHEAAVASAASDEAKRGPQLIAVTDEQIKAANVGLETVKEGAIGGEILAQAAVIPAPGGAASVTAHASGSVTRIFKQIGDKVRKGEVLAIVEGRDAAQIAADRSSANAKATLASRNLAREKSLFEQGVTPRAEYEQAQAEAAAASAEAHRAQSTAGNANVTGDGRGVAIVSPIDGSITAATAKIGAFVQSETEVFQVADSSQLQVEASISAEDVGRISAGDSAVLETVDGQTIEATVRSFTAALDPTTRVASAILDAKASNALRVGQTLRARITPQKTNSLSGLMVPDEAIQTLGGQDVVMVRTDKGFIAKPVLVGRRGTGRSEILKGLAPGQQIATRNAFVLKAEAGKGAEEE
jgi:cobalt-zinc-cadmium efflux system membrane fusion protein